jgi:hypothetical protein
MMRDGTGQRHSNVRRKRAKSGGRKFHQVASSETRPTNLHIRHQAEQPAVQQRFPPPRNPASITSQDVGKHSGRQERMTPDEV